MWKRSCNQRETHNNHHSRWTVTCVSNQGKQVPPQIVAVTLNRKCRSFNRILKVSKNPKRSRISQWKHFCCLHSIPASFVICSSSHDMVTVAHPTNAAPCKRGTSSLNNGTRFVAQKHRDHKETLHGTPISSLLVPSLAEVSRAGKFRGRGGGAKTKKQPWNRKTDQQLQSFQLHHYKDFPPQHFSVGRQQNKKKQGEKKETVYIWREL